MGQLSPLAPRIYQIQHCIRQFPFAPRAVSHSLVQWGYLFPLFICQVAGIRLSSFFFHVSILPLSFAFVNTASKKEIENRAVQANMTVTDYLTTCALGKRTIRIDGLDAVLPELKAQGRNLNQLTVLANMGRLTVVRGDDLAESCTVLCEQVPRLTQEAR